MLDINGSEFREIVMRVIEKVLAEQAAAPKRTVYVVFEDSFDVRYDSFLKTCIESDAVTAIVPDDWSQGLHDRIHQYCPFCQIIGQTAAGNLPLEGSRTVYPVASRDFIVKAALCIADTFQTKWVERCLAEGAAQHIMLKGLTKFTGKEPAGYVEKILSYYRTLLTYDVTIGGEYPQAIVPAAKPEITQPKRTMTLSGRVITAADLAGIVGGTQVFIESRAVITAYAQEEATQRDITFIRQR